MQDVRSQNVTAVSSIANIVKTSLGPSGLDKMLVDDIGDVTITNDGATILKLLEVEQPAAKVRLPLQSRKCRPSGEHDGQSPRGRPCFHGPMQQILVELAELQDQEVGDGTTSVVIVAAELLKRAHELVRNKIHPTSIIIGYRLAMREVRCSPSSHSGQLCCSWP